MTEPSTTRPGQTQNPDAARGGCQAGKLPETYRDTAGQLIDCGFTVERDEPTEPGSLFRTRLLRRASGSLAVASQVPELVLQRRLTHSRAERNWPQSDVLDNEIRIGLHLIRMFGEDSYPRELSRIVGYDNDADEPFVLLIPYPGERAGSAAGRLRLEEERSFEAGLFRALRLLEVTDVVHGRISPATVWWDKATCVVQVADFSQATRVGDPRRRTGQRPWSAIEQVTGTGVADTGDDVWSAGQLVFHVATGRPLDPGGTPPNLSVRGAALETLLADVFGPARARPNAAELLGRLKQPDPWPWPVSSSEPQFTRGQQIFDEQLAVKFPGSRPAAPPDPASTPGIPPRRGSAKSGSGFRRLFGPSLVAAAGLAASLLEAIGLVMKASVSS